MDSALTTSAFGDLNQIVEQLSKPTATSRPSKTPEAQLRIALRGMQQAQKQTDEENARLKTRLIDSKLVKGGEVDRLTTENESLKARLRQFEDVSRQLDTLRKERERALQASSHEKDEAAAREAKAAEGFESRIQANESAAQEREERLKEEREKALQASNQEKDDAAARQAKAAEGFERRIQANASAAQEREKRLEEELKCSKADKTAADNRLLQTQGLLIRSEESAQKLYEQVRELEVKLSEATRETSIGQDTTMVENPPAMQPDGLLVEALEASKQSETKLAGEVKLLRQSTDEQKTDHERSLTTEAAHRTDLEAKLSRQTEECTQLQAQLQNCEIQSTNLLSRLTQFNTLLRSLPHPPTPPPEEPSPKAPIREYALDATNPLDLHTPTTISSSRSTPAAATAGVSSPTTTLRTENADLRTRLTVLEAHATDLQTSVEQYSDQYAEYMLAAITSDIMALDLAFSLYYMVLRLIVREKEGVGKMVAAVLGRQYDIRREQVRGKLEHFFGEEGKGVEAGKLIAALGKGEWEGVEPLVRVNRQGSLGLAGGEADGVGSGGDEDVEIVDIGWPEGWRRSGERREWVDGVLSEIKPLLGL